MLSLQHAPVLAKPVSGIIGSNCRKERTSMDADRKHPIVHLVGSIPLPDAETGIRKTWIRFLQDVLANNPAIELAADVPPFKFTQWDGKVVREIPRLRVKPGATPDAKSFKTGYAIWRWNRGACSIACSRLASFRRR